MPRIELCPHPAAPMPGWSLSASARRGAGGSLRLSYQLLGDLSGLALPAPGPEPGRRDELWKRTCFETFIRGSGGPAYLEFNVSPAGDWAIYAFTAYRRGMSAPPAPDTPRLHVVRTSGCLALNVELFPPGGAGVDLNDSLALGLAAVLEARDGGCSWWALRHPPGPPDFHHADGFALTLESRS